MKLNNIIYWISGHTRLSYNINNFNCNFISNQVAYQKKIGTTNFIKDGLFII